ncbi:MAG TPA: hypothetical protein VG893_09760 [Terracidiphilus sp.]|nr:hypothetical protein [Terracidiphilus sp.]
MKRTLLCLLFVAAVAALAWAAPPAVQRSAYRIDFNVRLGDAIPADAVIICKVRIAPELAAGAPGWPAPIPETATSVATITGSVAHCAVQVPSTWAVADAHRAAVLSYEVDAETPAAMHAVVGREMELPQAEAGGVERVELSLAL